MRVTKILQLLLSVLTVFIRGDMIAIAIAATKFSLLVTSPLQMLAIFALRHDIGTEHAGIVVLIVLNLMSESETIGTLRQNLVARILTSAISPFSYEIKTLRHDGVRLGNGGELDDDRAVQSIDVVLCTAKNVENSLAFTDRVVFVQMGRIQLRHEGYSIIRKSQALPLMTERQFHAILLVAVHETFHGPS